MDSTAMQVITPLVAAGVSAYSPRYGASGVQGGLAALGAVNHMRMQDFQLKQQQGQRDAFEKTLQTFSKPQVEDTSQYGGGAGGDAPKATALATQQQFEAGGQPPSPTQQGHTYLTPDEIGQARLAEITNPGSGWKYVHDTLAEKDKRSRLPTLAALQWLDRDKLPPWLSELSGETQEGLKFQVKPPEAPTGSVERFTNDQGQRVESVTNPKTGSFIQEPRVLGNVQEQEGTPYKTFVADFKRRTGRDPGVQDLLAFRRQEAQAGQLPPQMSAEDAALQKENPGWTTTQLAQFKKSGVTPEQVKRAAHSLISLDPDELVAMNELVGRGAVTRLDLFDEAARQAAAEGRKFSPQATKRKLEAIDAFSASGKEGAALASAGMFLEHAAGAADAYSQLSRSNNKYINKAKSWWESNMSGDPAYATFINSFVPVQAELNKYLQAPYAPTVEETKVITDALDKNASPAAMYAGLKASVHVAKAKFTEQNYRYKRTVGSDIKDPFSPEALAAAKKFDTDLLGGGAQNAPAGGGGEAPIGTVIQNGNKRQVKTANGWVDQ